MLIKSSSTPSLAKNAKGLQTYVNNEDKLNIMTKNVVIEAIDLKNKREQNNKHLQSMLSNEYKLSAEFNQSRKELQHQFDRKQDKSVAELIEEGKVKSMETALRKKFPIEHIDSTKRKNEIAMFETKKKNLQDTVRNEQVHQLQNIELENKRTHQNYVLKGKEELERISKVQTLTEKLKQTKEENKLYQKALEKYSLEQKCKE